MFERPDSGERAVLVHITFPDGRGGDDRDEFADLAISAGVAPVATVTGRRRAPDPRHFIGAGKLAELGARVAAEHADVVIFNQALSPAQERNLESALGCRVLDRITLILDIFAQRASTAEGKLQVELAQLRHLSTRLVRGWTHLERQKGGIGLRGPGEKQLETDRRLVTERIRAIERRLERVGTRRELSRRSRSRAGVPVVALVGYTNAGKSTLFNALTGARVGTADQLFATLDPTLRRIELEGGQRLILADTVGFISDLPHELVAAFRATLEETRRASLLLHVVDAGDPHRADKIVQVNRVLDEIGAGDIAQIHVFNKVDACPQGANALNGAAAPRRREGESAGPTRVWVSALKSTGLERLTEAIGEHFRAATVVRQLRLPASAGRLRARLYELGSVVAERTEDNGDWLIEVNIAPAALERLRRREGLAPTLVSRREVGENCNVEADLPVAGTPKAS
ncbi:MAG: GTPase HflX [Gammaproteobacteria bacterium]|nr:GTPase HflX [Gammaproteobacteria bacterium]NIM72841.1 GTPase HflX [Gammaproteobacteria bacterium]NIN38299.1 GTPase HflX [Gammaproteobacteria bacterium]NIO24589.1 GTPase HflX [Gammaproteobacteria bacterium]NIO65198.1 GTPase HflX [Gammaproteobacteria bacterium]